MHVVVTGAAGRLGQVLVPLLLDEPAIGHITAIDRRPVALEHPKLTALVADVRELPAATFAGADVLIHMAFVLMGGGLGRARHDRETVRAINVEGSRRALEPALDAGLSRLIFLSSAAVYGAWPDNPPRIPEHWLRRPLPSFAYAEDKVAVEDWLDALEPRVPDARILRLRPQAIVGPHAHPLLNRLLRQPFVPAGRAAPLQCVWESDVAEAVRLALFADARGAFNLAADPPMSLRDMLARRGVPRLPLPLPLIERLHRLAWRATPRVGEPGWVAGLRHGAVVDCTRAKTLLGWRPRLDTPACLKALVPGRGTTSGMA
ncbi:MAG: NAD-dependent epimerase/dehydratase family protein [Ectothiorhodospiraceae bacterium]|jgi:nucleoside-diphosphate-sugar epimerase|nr:NAD-dependent epimerase/dehydratase family protein [Ectothiorhodospiraceae bacterium]